MAITEGSVLQEIILHVNLIKLRSYITAPDPGPDELQTPPMDGTVDLPQIQVALRRDVVQKQGPLQCCVVPAVKREILGPTVNSQYYPGEWITSMYFPGNIGHFF